jgi:hypothetical protein
VTANSRALSASEHDADPSYATLQRQCELVAELCRATAPIRVDARREHEAGAWYGQRFAITASSFFLFVVLLLFMFLFAFLFGFLSAFLVPSLRLPRPSGWFGLRCALRSLTPL